MLMSQASRKQQNPVLTLYVTFGGGAESRYTFYYFPLQKAKKKYVLFYLQLALPSSA